jgi:hypothetical protein
MSKRFNPDFEPILLEDDTATLYGTGLPDAGMNVKCIAVGSLPEYWNDFGALTAGTWDTEQSDSNLAMNTMEMAQYRMRVVSEMKLQLKHPGSVQQWKTRDRAFYLPQFPSNDALSFLAEYFFTASEFLVFEDNTPQFDLYATRTQTNSFVIFSGWRFKLESINTPGKIKLWTSEWPSNSPTPRYPR